MSHLLAIFITVFLAELGDKTQLATLLFATEKQQSPWLVFLAASAALIVATGIAVLLGNLAARHIEGLPLKLIAGIGFLGIGVWTIWGHFQQA